MNYPYLVGYVYSKDERSEYFLKATSINIASFIVTNSPLDTIQITTPLDKPFLSTCAGFIDYCPDQEFLMNELLPVLIPMQLGDAEPSEVELVPEDEMNLMYDEEWGYPNIKL